MSQTMFRFVTNIKPPLSCFIPVFLCTFNHLEYKEHEMLPYWLHTLYIAAVGTGANTKNCKLWRWKDADGWKQNTYL